jgi:hypothetical protein
MKLKKVVVHERHENTRTNPKNLYVAQYNRRGYSLNEFNSLLYFMAFVFLRAGKKTAHPCLSHLVDELRLLVPYKLNHVKT